MALTEKKVYQIEVTETDQIQVRTKRIILDNGEPISSALHRHVVVPGQDVSGEIGKVRRMAAAAHVPTVVDKYQKRQAVEQIKELHESEAKKKRKNNEPPFTAEEEAAFEQAILDAEVLAEAAEAAHEAFLEAEDS